MNDTHTLKWIERDIIRSEKVKQKTVTFFVVEERKKNEF